MLKSFFTPCLAGLFFLFLFPFISQSQELKIKNNYGGVVSIGARNTISTFNDGKWGDVGIGTGGQFMVQATNRVNTAWFLDYISAGVGDFAHRTDCHIGWSVMYYLIPSSSERAGNEFVTKVPKIQPYILAGHCFDYSLLKENTNTSNFAERWSSAVQAGLGAHYNFSPRAEITLQGQYMIHLGNDIEAEKVNGTTVFNQPPGANLQGHILITIGINYKLGDLWSNLF